MLFIHLRQLEAAGRIIQHNVSQSDTQSAAAADASLPSRLALMHAMNNQAKVKQFLIMRLEAAVAARIKDRGVRAQYMHCKMQAEGLDRWLDCIEAFMKTFPCS